jgi:hypothetical protein
VSTATSVIEQLQTPLYRRPHVESQASIGHMLDSLEWREGDPEGSAEDLMVIGDSLLSLGLVLVPKEEAFQLLSNFLEDLEQGDEFLENGNFVLSHQNREALASELAPRMANRQQQIVGRYDLESLKVPKALGLSLRSLNREGSCWGSCYGNAATRHAEQCLLVTFSGEVLYWLEKVPLPTSSDQPSLTERFREYLASI